MQVSFRKNTQVHGERLYSHGQIKCTVRFHLCAKHEISKLGKRYEDDDKHNGKCQEVLGTRRHRRGQLRHCSIEADELKQLQGTQHR